MHSVVVLGDVRTHRVKYGRETITIYGGASMMRDHIVDVIESIEFETPKSGPAAPNIFSFKEFDVDRDGVLGFEVKTWKTQKEPLKESIYRDESNSKRPRLRIPAEEINSLEKESDETEFFPEISQDLIRALGRYRPVERRADGTFPEPPSGRTVHSGHFDPPDARTPWCPDIIVLDDLDGPMRRLELPVSDSGSGIPFLRQSRSTEDEPRWRRSEAKYAKVLRTILDRVIQASSPIAARSSGPSLEPVIVCSVMGRPPRLSTQDPDLSNAPKQLWDILYQDTRLRRRTIVILDVKDLRDSESQLTISPGASWEMTAQDIIVEMNRSPGLRRLLDFSQVIIRIGHTGALQITRCDERESTYQLYFDPCRDEAIWNEPDDGIVLGQTSLFASAIVEELIRNCNANSDHPVLQDLAEVVGQSIPIAIRSCQEMMNRGLTNLPDEPAPIGLPLRPIDRLSAISCVAVPSYRNRSWSILSQVSQGQVGTIARNIVRYGTQFALLQSVPSIRGLIRSVSDAASDVVARAIWPNMEGRRKWQIGLDAEEDQSVFEELADRASPEGPKWELERGGSKFDLGDLLRMVIARRVESQVRLLSEHAKALAKYFSSREHVDAIRKRTESILSKNYDRELRRAISEWPDLRKGHIDTVFQFERWVEQYFRDELDTNLRNDPRFRPVVAPVFQVDERVALVDRREIEGVRELRKRIRTHMDKVNKENDPTRNNPLNLAVFGPPGAGKSIMVKGVIKSLGYGKRCTELTFNLAQFSAVADLDEAFKEIGNVSGENKVPVVFFDEFDCRFNGEPWGWLKYLLSPMEDGKYRGTPVHTAIFVFAGGTSSTYSEFNRIESDLEFQKFVLAKGPDFSSRLSGHLNVVGVNPADDDDQLYLIRRAVVIRSTLEKIQKKVIERNNNMAQIDEDILRAILFVPTYKNGARSIRKLIEMCPGSDERLQNSALPSLQQLNMVTNGKAFLDQLYRVSEADTSTSSRAIGRTWR